jgi:hypothetical protein
MLGVQKKAIIQLPFMLSIVCFGLLKYKLFAYQMANHEFYTA